MGFKGILRYFLEKAAYPLCNLVFETFSKRYVIVSTSVRPLRYNWGDYVSVVLCGLVNSGNRYIPRRYTWNVFGKEDILCIGSIITWMTTPRSIIWGSGIVYPNKEISAIPKKVLAVRGPLTREYLIKRGIACPEVYGDPALLFPRFYQPPKEKKYKLGIIPHFRDKENPLIGKYAKEKSVLIIDVQSVHPWHKFIDDICSCEYIASSSLHGIIISDAYQVPNVWIELEGGERKTFAFKDYLYSVGKANVDAFPIVMDTDINELINKCRCWKSIDIDLEKLLAVCPFNVNTNE